MAKFKYRIPRGKIPAALLTSFDLAYNKYHRLSYNYQYGGRICDDSWGSNDPLTGICRQLYSNQYRPIWDLAQSLSIFILTIKKSNTVGVGRVDPIRRPARRFPQWKLIPQ